jgi:hypothetical protein
MALERNFPCGNAGGIVRLVQPYLRLHEFLLFGSDFFLVTFTACVLYLDLRYSPRRFLKRSRRVVWDDTTCFTSTI